MAEVEKNRRPRLPRSGALWIEKDNAYVLQILYIYHNIMHEFFFNFHIIAIIKIYTHKFKKIYTQNFIKIFYTQNVFTWPSKKFHVMKISMCIHVVLGLR